MRIPIHPDFWKTFIRRRLKKDYWVILVKKRIWLKRAFVAFCAVLLMSVVGLSCFMYFYGNLKDSRGQPIDWDKIKNEDFKKTSYVLASNDEIIDRSFIENRDLLKENEVSELLADGFVAAEDERFWLHPGIDPIAITRAAAGYVLRWSGIELWPPSGGSTITQQEARLLYAEEIPEFGNRAHTFTRKLKEAHFAIQLTKRYSKKQLLTAFLNTPYFGHGTHGVAEAWRLYFGEDVRNRGKLEKNKIAFIQKIAVVVALNKSPEKYCPIFHFPAKPIITPRMTEEQIAKLNKEYETALDKEKFRIRAARKRDNWVLYQMLEEGCINKKEYRAALFDENENLASLNILKITPLKDASFGYGSRMAKEILLGAGLEDEEITHYGGLKIKTCIDAGIQKILNDELGRHLAKLNKEVGFPTNQIDASGVIIEVKTGCIVALTGGHSYKKTPYNRALALRSVGSAFKPMVYGAAIEYAGKTFEDQLLNASFRMMGADGKPWSPKNFGEENPVPFGYIPFPVGLIRSVNLPTLNLAREIGMEPIVKFAHQLGIWGVRGIVKNPDGKIVFRIPGVEDTGDGIIPLLPTAIGGSDTNLIETVNGYAVFFRKGVYLPPRLIIEVKDSNGDFQYKVAEPKPRQVISQETARKILILMRAITKVGTAKISMRGIEQQVACKTGTSNNPNKKLGDGPGDVSTICGTSKLIMGIRIGYDIPRPIIIPQYMKEVSGRSDMQVSGGWVAALLSRIIWDRIYEKRPKVEFAPEVERGLQELLVNYPEKYK